MPLTPTVQIDALVENWRACSLDQVLRELVPTPGSPALRRLAAARVLGQRGTLPQSALDALAEALGDCGSVNMEPDVTPDPYMTPPEAVRHDSVCDEALAALVGQGGAALPVVCAALLRGRAHGYQVQRWLAQVGGEVLLAIPKQQLQASIASLLHGRNDPSPLQAIVTALAWAEAHPVGADSLHAQLCCPIGEVRASAATALALRDGESALPSLLQSVAKERDAVAACGMVRALHSVITADTPLDVGALRVLEGLAASYTATAEMVKVCEIFARLGARAALAIPTLEKLASRQPMDVYDYHTRDVSRAAQAALKAIRQ